MLVKLLLAHLLGDYLFQSKQVVQWKNRSFPGHFVHYGIVGVCNLVLFLEVIQQFMVIVGLLVITFAHALIDECKIKYLKSNPQKDHWGPFLIDQLLHLLVILVIYAWWKNAGLSPALHNRSEGTCLWLALLVSNTYAVSLFVYYIFKEVTANNGYRRDYLLMAMRIAITALTLTAGPTFALVLLAGVTWFFHRTQPNMPKRKVALAGNTFALLISWLVYLLR